MVWFVSVAIAIVLCGVAFLFGRAMRSEAEPGSPESDRGLIVIVLAIIVFVLWAGAHTALSALKQIEAGQRGGRLPVRSRSWGAAARVSSSSPPWQQIRTESIKRPAGPLRQRERLLGRDPGGQCLRHGQLPRRPRRRWSELYRDGRAKLVRHSRGAAHQPVLQGGDRQVQHGRHRPQPRDDSRERARPRSPRTCRSSR